MRKSILVAVDSFHTSTKYKATRKTTSKLMVSRTADLLPVRTIWMRSCQIRCCRTEHETQCRLTMSTTNAMLETG